jgi:ATP-binding protein involved in chromosome partitioning
VPDPARHTPTEIKQDGPGALAIQWADGASSRYPVRELRLACACAHCVDEWSGEPRLDPASIPEDVEPTKIASVGRYAIQIRWSDGHDTGIYSWQYLREIEPPPADGER